MSKYSVFILMALFECGVFIVHYYIMGQVMLKTGESDPLIIQGFSIMWGAGASLVPIIGFYVCYYFGEIERFFTKTKQASQEHDSRKGVSVFVVIMLIFMLIVFIGETNYVYDFFYKKTNLFAQSSFDISTLLKAVSVAILHFVITGMAVLFLYVFTAKSFDNFIDSHLNSAHN